MSKHRKIPYALDSYIIINEKTKKRTIVYGKRDRAYLSTESMINKINNKPSRKALQKTKAELGNKEGKRYYIEYMKCPSTFDWFGLEDITKSRYYLSHGMAERIALQHIRNDDYLQATIYEETNIDEEWQQTKKEYVYK